MLPLFLSPGLYWKSDGKKNWVWYRAITLIMKGILMTPLIKKLLAVLMLLSVAAGAGAGEHKEGKNNNWDITIGAGGIYGPVSPGVDEYEFSALPYIDIEYKNRFFIKSQYGIGAYLFRSDTGLEYAVGAAIGYDGGRDEDDASDQLQGLGDIDGSAEAILFAEIELGPVEFGLELAQGLNDDGHDGFRAELSAGIDKRVTDDLMLGMGPFLTYGDGQYIESYYGVTSVQAARSSIYDEYETDGGFESYGLEVNARYMMTDHWALTGFASYTRLMGDAKDSPIVDDAGFWGGGAFLSYTF